MDSFQAKVRSRGLQIFALSEGQGKSIFNKDWWYGKVMEWSLKNEHFKTQMFRFVDVLPSLSSNSEVSRHLQEYFAQSGEELPALFNIGAGLGSLAPGLMAGTVRKNVQGMAKIFITGETPAEALSVLKKARKNSICFTLDLLGESTLSEKEAFTYQARYLDLIEWIANDAASWESNPQIDEDHLGPLPKVNVSVKLSALYSQVNTRAWTRTKEVLKERLRPILSLAQAKGVFINLDMEHYGLKDLTLEVFEDLILEPEYRDYPHWGCVLQAYLRDSYRDTKRLIELGQKRKTPFTVRLVKGAYWDYETVLAEQRRWPVPVYTDKAESDANYETCAFLLLENQAVIRTAFASHNVRSLSACLVKAEELGIDPRAFEIQMLFGMADDFKQALVKSGFRVREYAPVGELLPGMAYLVRRLLENTSNESFLRSKHADGVAAETLLRDPRQKAQTSSSALEREPDRFYNEAPLDFALPSVRARLAQAFERIEGQYGRTYPLVINGERVDTPERITRENPSSPRQILGSIASASIEDAERAVQVAHGASASWSLTSAESRAEKLDKLAELILRDRYELMAWQTAEVGKSWAEADGDITEAADFCRYYARQMRSLEKGERVGRVSGESSVYRFGPRGVTAVIAPWNFPLAILTGMAGAALVSGNPVVMKPAEQSSIMGAKLMDLIAEAGFPHAVCHYLPGAGEVVGDYLVNHPLVSTIAFTGSKDVGLKIVAASARVQPGQRFVKRCIVEMGGKNAIIVDSDADLDEAVHGVLSSAFGFQGQKCSACSRVIVLSAVYERFRDRLIEAARSLRVGSAHDPENAIGPVVDAEAQRRILSVIEAGKAQARLAYQGEVPSEGYFVPPTIFCDVAPGSSLAQEEIFGPVLSMIEAESLEQALHIANDTPYALTGGLFSRSPATIERVKKEMNVGNLYINRGITGAMVDRHPFGGFKLSGLGSKTGGPDYLKQFMDPRCVTENTLRRGFAPSATEEA